VAQPEAERQRLAGQDVLAGRDHLGRLTHEQSKGRSRRRHQAGLLEGRADDAREVPVAGRRGGDAVPPTPFTDPE